MADTIVGHLLGKRQTDLLGDLFQQFVEPGVYSALQIDIAIPNVAVEDEYGFVLQGTAQVLNPDGHLQFPASAPVVRCAPSSGNSFSPLRRNSGAGSPVAGRNRV